MSVARATRIGDGDSTYVRLRLIDAGTLRHDLHEIMKTVSQKAWNKTNKLTMSYEIRL